jgi:hypothetical protein
MGSANGHKPQPEPEGMRTTTCRGGCVRWSMRLRTGSGFARWMSVRSAGRGDRRADDRRRSGLLDLSLDRYTGARKQSFPGPVSASGLAGHRLVLAGLAGFGHLAAVPPPGQRNGYQIRRSRGPPKRVRYKPQPEPEGIETVVVNRYRRRLGRGLLQTPARTRGHRNAVIAVAERESRISATGRYKPQPEPEGIETPCRVRRGEGP